VWTDSCPSIAGVGCDLIGLGAGEEHAQKVYARVSLGVEQTSRPCSRDLVASEIKCWPHGRKNRKTNSCTVSWLKLKTKVKSGRSWRPSHEWQLAFGCIKSAGFAVVHHKTTGVSYLIHKTRLKTRWRRGDHPGRSNYPGGAV
jgi:hypothetical protein